MATEKWYIELYLEEKLMSIFNFNEGEKNVVSAYGKLTAISMIAGIAFSLGGFGVLHLSEKLDDKRNLVQARDALKEQLDNCKDREEKYKVLYAEADRAGAEARRKLFQLQLENQRLEEKLEKLNSMATKTEGLGD